MSEFGGGPPIPGGARPDPPGPTNAPSPPPPGHSGTSIPIGTQSTRNPGGASWRPPQKGRRKSGGAIKFVSDKGIPLLIAVLGLLTAMATAWGAIKTAEVKDLEASQASLEGANAELAEEKESLGTQVSQLEEELTTAQEGPADPVPLDDGDEAGTPLTTSPPRSAVVLRETAGTPLVFSSGYEIDLDSEAPDWGVARSGGDLSFHYGSSGAYVGTGEVALVDHIPTKQECEDATVLLPNLPDEQARDGLQVCMRSSDDRVVYLHVVDINEDAKTITVDLTVWE